MSKQFGMQKHEQEGREVMDLSEETPLVWQVIPPRTARRDLPALETAMAALALDERHPIALEIAGSATERMFLVPATSKPSQNHLADQLYARYPQASLLPLSGKQDPLQLRDGEALSVLELIAGAASYLLPARVLGVAGTPAHDRHAWHSLAGGKRGTGCCLAAVHTQRYFHPALPAHSRGDAGQCHDGFPWSRDGCARQRVCVDLTLGSRPGSLDDRFEPWWDGDVLAAAESGCRQNRPFPALVGCCSKWSGSAGAHALASLSDARSYLGWPERPGGGPAQKMRAAGPVGHGTADAATRECDDPLSACAVCVWRPGAVALLARTAPHHVGSTCTGKRERQQVLPKKSSPWS